MFGGGSFVPTTAQNSDVNTDSDTHKSGQNSLTHSGRFGQQITKKYANNETPGIQTHKRTPTFTGGEERQDSSDEEPFRTSANEDSENELVRSLHSIDSMKSDFNEDQYNNSSDLKIVGLNIKEVAVQTDIVYNDKRFTSKRMSRGLMFDGD